MSLNGFLIVLTVLASSSAAVVVWRARTAHADPIDELLSAIVVGFAVLFGTAHVLGQIGDATGTAMFTPALMAVVTICAMLGLAAGLRPVPGTTSVSVDRPGRWSRIDRVALGATIALFVVLLGVLLLIGPIGFEGLAYHLPIAAFMFQSRSLRIWDPLFMNVYPADASVLVALLLELGGERLASIAGMVFAPPCALAIYRLSLAAGADRQIALVLTLGFCFLPLFCFGTVEVASDVQGLAFALIAVSFVVLRPRTRLPWWLLAGLAGGLAFSAKSLYLITLAAAAIASVVAYILVADRRSLSWTHSRRAILPVLGFGIVAAVFASYWMVRNFVAFGNPLYPIAVPVMSNLFGWPGSQELAKFQNLVTQFEWVRSSAEWFVYPWIEHHVFDQNLKASSGLGPFFALVGPPAWVCAFAIAVRILLLRHRSREEIVIFSITVLIALSLTVWWVLGDRQPRYALGALALTFPLASGLATGLTGWQRGVFLGAGRACILASAVLFLASFALQNGGFARSALMPRHERFEYPALLDQLPSGSVVINLFDRTANYIAFGRAWTNVVVAYHPETMAPGREAQVFSIEHLRSLGPGPVHVFGSRERLPLAHGCVRSELVDSLTLNPFNRTPLPMGRFLHRVTFEC